MKNQLLKAVTLPLLAGLAIHLTGCATVTPETAAYIKAQKAIISQKPMSLLTDACVTREQLGPTIMLINPSEGLAKVTHSELLTELGKRNITPNKVDIPFVCAAANTITSTKVKKLKGFVNVGGEEVMPQGQFFTTTDSTINQNQALQTALSELLTQLVLATYPASNYKKPPSGNLTLDLTPSALNALQEAYGSDYLWFHTTKSTTPSLGLTFAAAASNAAAVVLVPGGAAYANPAAIGSGKSSSSSIYVIDLGAGELVYTAATRSNSAMSATQKISSHWASSLLNQLLTPTR